MELEEIRQQINRVDEQLKELFLERMWYAAQVAEAKGQTGGSVYVPEREQEILRLRQQGVKEELVPECRSFFRQMIGLSRTYQYSMLLGVSTRLSQLPDGDGEVVVAFFCDKGSEGLASVFGAAAVAGLSIVEMNVCEGCRDAECEQEALGGENSSEESMEVLQEQEGKAGRGIYPEGNRETEQKPESRLHCKIRLAGNFAEDLAKAAVWQILEELEDAALL